MKTQKIIRFTSVIIMTVLMIYITSCTKESEQSPANSSASLQDALMEKTNEGKQATLTDAVNSSVSTDQTRNCNSKVFPPNANMFGSSYETWSAKWWKWGMEFPIAGHPFVNDPTFDVSAGQSGKVWYLAAPFGTVVRNITIPHGKALFVGLVNAEASDLEGLGNTYVDRLNTANWFADHIVSASLSCTVDGLSVNTSSYRFVSPEFTFVAPTPWIYGATGGSGTSVSDGYFVMVKPLSPGNHTLHYTGAFHFTLANDGFDFDASLDMTYNITVL